MVSVDVLPMLEEEARKRQERLGRELGGNPTLTQKIGEGLDKHAGEATEQAAKLFNTNRQYVSDAKNIQT